MTDRREEGAARQPPAALRRFSLTLLLVPFAPRWVARLNQDTSLRAALAVHLTALVLALAIGLAILGVPNDLAMASYAAPETHPQPPPFAQWALLLYALAGLGGGLLGGGLVAVGLLGWSWQDETLADTWRHALKTSWLCTPIILGPTAVGATVAAGVIESDSPGGVEVHIWLTALCLCWMLGVCWKAATTERPFNRVETQPLCEECGYVLLYSAVDRPCPECGEPAERSLNPARRTLAPWDREAPPDQRPGFAAINIAIWADEARFFFGRLRLTGGLAHAHSFLVWHLLAAVVAGIVLFVGGISALAGEAPPRDVFRIYAGFSVILITITYMGWCVVTSVLGLLASRSYGRNLLGPMTLVAAYVSGFLVVWAAADALLTVAILAVYESGPRLNWWWGPAVWLTFQGGMLALYVIFLWRRVRFVRYANWGEANGVELKPAAPNGATGTC